MCDFADYFVLCNADSERQIEAVRDEINSRLTQEGMTPLHREGDATSGWVLLDYGGVVVHIFTPTQRNFYQLDALWSRALPLLRIQ